MSITYPFVNQKMAPTSNISSEPLLIFGNDNYTCLIYSIMISNTCDSAISIFVSVAREQIVGVESYFKLAYRVLLPASTRIDILQGQAFTMHAGDLLYVNCDTSLGLFDAFVVYRELVESLPPTPPLISKKIGEYHATPRGNQS